MPRYGILSTSAYWWPTRAHVAYYLPAGHTVVAEKDIDGVRLRLIEGPEMPDPLENGAPPWVTLHMKSIRNADNSISTFARWEHRPQQWWPTGKWADDDAFRTFLETK